MSDVSATDSAPHRDTRPSPDRPDLTLRLELLEKELETERRQNRERLEDEARERQRQFSLLLEEMSKAIEKMERRDLKLEKGLRSELTRQNRFIYEEFQTRVARLNAALEKETVAIRGTKVDRDELRDLVYSLLGNPARSGSTPDALLS